jgi:hypothetical protein
MLLKTKSCFETLHNATARSFWIFVWDTHSTGKSAWVTSHSWLCDARISQPRLRNVETPDGGQRPPLQPAKTRFSGLRRKS